MPQTFALREGVYSSTATTTDEYDGNGTGTNVNTGEVSPISGSITSDISDGTTAIVEQTSAISPNPVTLKYLDANYVIPGNNVEPDGNVMVADATSGVATETLTDHGVTWSLRGAADPDGVHIDVSYTGSNGVSAVQQIDANELSQNMYTAAQSVGTRTESTAVHTMGDLAVPGAVVTLAGAAVGLVGASLVVAGLVLASPALALGAAVVGVVGAAVTVAGAAIQLSDALNDKKKAKKN